MSATGAIRNLSPQPSPINSQKMPMISRAIHRPSNKLGGPGGLGGVVKSGLGKRGLMADAFERFHGDWVIGY